MDQSPEGSAGVEERQAGLRDLTEKKRKDLVSKNFSTTYNSQDMETT